MEAARYIPQVEGETREEAGARCRRRRTHHRCHPRPVGRRRYREYRQLVVDLGAHSQASQRRAEIQAATVIEVDAERVSQSGVNLDEEMSNLVQFERSYQAAAKVIATIDEMLDVLINRM